MNDPAPPPVYVTPPPDPMFAQLQAQSDKDNMAALTSQAASDTSSIMARYGAYSAYGMASGVTNLPAAQPQQPDSMFSQQQVLAAFSGMKGF